MHRVFLFRLSRRRRCWGDVHGQHQDVPIIALASINRSPIALAFYRTAGLALKSLTPFSTKRDILSRNYNAVGIRSGFDEMVAKTPFLEQVYKNFSMASGP